jgi:hypothetical protein
MNERGSKSVQRPVVRLLTVTAVALTAATLGSITATQPSVRPVAMSAPNHLDDCPGKKGVRIYSVDENGESNGDYSECDSHGKWQNHYNHKHHEDD